jgi:hypothetical protein
MEIRGWSSAHTNILNIHITIISFKVKEGLEFHINKQYSLLQINNCKDIHQNIKGT